MRLAGNFSISVLIMSTVLITAAIGLTAKKSSPIESVSTSGPQYSAKESNNLNAQSAGKGDEQKYKLLVRVEPPASDSQEGPSLYLTIRNDSRRIIYIVDTGRPWDFKFDIKDTSGRTVSPRKNDLQLLRDGGKRSLDPIKAGQEISYIINLVDLYDLAGGEYLLTVKRDIFLRNKQTIVEIESAPITLTLP